MVNKQFLGFLDRLKTEKNEALVESVKKGYILCECGPEVAPAAGAADATVQPESTFDSPIDSAEYLTPAEENDFNGTAEFDENGDPIDAATFIDQRAGEFDPVADDRFVNV